MKTLDKLNNGCYILARNENIVLAYNGEANELVTWEIDNDATQQTIDGGYYSINQDGFNSACGAALDCYFKRAGINASSDHKAKLKEFIWQRIKVLCISYTNTAYWDRICDEENAELQKAWHRHGGE